MRTCTIIFLILIITGLYSQEIKTDSLHTGNFKLAAIETAGINLVVWSVDHYIAKAEWANISLESVKNNLKNGFVFDDSEFLMNQFLHPYHGNMYFNSARCNGLSFWQSVPFAFAGSLTWELFMEIESPSNNDLFTTTLGGIMLGEVTYRVSSLILDDSAFGAERTWRELGAGLIDPIRGLNRLFQGRTREIHKTHRQERQAVIGDISFGGNTVGEGLDLNNGKESPILKLQFVYGTPFLKDKRKPFDYFNLHLGLNLKGIDTITSFYGEALLFGKNLNFQGNPDGMVQDNLFGMFQHFDYIANDVYKVAASALGGGVISRFSAYDGMNLYTSGHLSVIVLGGSNSAYAEQAERDYNLGPGVSGKFEGWLVNEKYGEMLVSYLRYWIYTLSGAEGQERIEITSVKVETPISKNFKLGGEYLYYYRQGVYVDYKDITAENNEFRTFISYRF
ncbi:DUF3943 domain-containing protein [Candidatus Cloacimonadota bacterium]